MLWQDTSAAFCDLHCYCETWSFLLEEIKVLLPVYFMYVCCLFLDAFVGMAVTERRVGRTEKSLSSDSLLKWTQPPRPGWTEVALGVGLLSYHGL